MTGVDWPFLKQYPCLEGSAHPFHSTDFPECLRLCVFLQQVFIITCDVSGTVQGSRVVTVYQRPLLNTPRMSLPQGLCTHLPGTAGLAAFSPHLPSSLESPGLHLALISSTTLSLRKHRQVRYRVRKRRWPRVRPDCRCRSSLARQEGGEASWWSGGDHLTCGRWESSLIVRTLVITGLIWIIRDNLPF